MESIVIEFNVMEGGSIWNTLAFKDINANLDVYVIPRIVDE